MKEFDILHTRYSLLREAHVEGLISDYDYIIRFELIVDDMLSLLNSDISFYDVNIQTNNTENLNQLHHDLATQRYEYLKGNYNIMRAVYDQTVAAYSQMIQPPTDQ